MDHQLHGSGRAEAHDLVDDVGRLEREAEGLPSPRDLVGGQPLAPPFRLGQPRASRSGNSRRSRDFNASTRTPLVVPQGDPQDRFLWAPVQR